MEEELLELIENNSKEAVNAFFGRNGVGAVILSQMPPASFTKILMAKNVKIFGGINPYVEDFIPSVAAGLARMPEGPAKERAKTGQRALVDAMLNQPGLSDENKRRLQASLDGELAAAAAGGKRRKMSRKYCRKTPCRKMGFTQRSSCRPYKNCF